MQHAIDKWLSEKLNERKVKNIWRSLPAQNNGIDFTSNDYLGFAQSEKLFHAIQQKIESLPKKNGSSGSRLLSGNSSYTEQVESKLAHIFKSQAALIFNSGYSANLAVLSSIPQKGDTILYDSLAHASLKDGARLSLATRHSFRHNDLEDLERKIKASKGKKYIVVESIYSMDGDECPLNEIVKLAERHQAAIILDEAHSTGVAGPQGAGYCVEENLQDKVDIRIYTFGKAMGVHGACVAGSKALIGYLINFARPFIYTTALSQHQVASIDCAFEFLSSNLDLQHMLAEKISLYLRAIGKLSNRTASLSAIQTILCPGKHAAKEMSEVLQNSGFDVRPILHPTVPEGKERLRICLHTFNSDDEINSLAQALVAVV
ncbi:MAG: 8-amino-7-oxononanoate synthase [Cyclobacteriaceae bacterium]